MTNWLYFADTPLQLYNSYLLASSNANKDDASDVIIYSQFSGAAELGEVYRQTNRFRFVYLCTEHYCANFKQRFLWQLYACLGGSRLNLSHLKNIHYDYFAFACPTPAALDVLQTLRKINPDVKTVLFEDGTGIYNGNVFLQPFYFDKPPDTSLCGFPYVRAIQSTLTKLHAKKMLYNPCRLYAKKPELLQYSPNIPCEAIEVAPHVLEPLACLAPQNEKLLRNEKKTIILDVPRTKQENEGSQLIDQMVQAAQIFDSPCYVRAHPRSTLATAFGESCIDFSEGSWELLCQTPCFDDSILISLGSSAQLAPFIESGKKPFLIFLYKLAFEQGNRSYEAYDQIASIAAQGYGIDANRIAVPVSIDDAVLAISKFMDE